MAKQKQRRVDVVKKRSGWVAATKSGRTRIHGRDGTLQEERTYPRCADPRSSKG